MAESCKASDGSDMWTFGLDTKWTILLGGKAQVLERVAIDQKEYKGKRRGSDDWENVESCATGKANNGEKADKEWDGIVGFFHPFCNAGGGGERVLWAAILATQKRWPNAKCIVYTGDHDVDKPQIISRVKDRFNIQLHPPTITFLYLTTRHWVLASTWPHFTLLGQSIGSLILAWDAFSLVVPDIFVDTMGYAFALGFSKILFPEVPTGAYVHYPTISTDMLGSLDPTSATGNQGVNAGKVSAMTLIQKRVYQLRLLANELHIKDDVEFHLDAPWPKILEWLGKASVGVNGMWNEHFGIGVVEYQAAGLISVVHDSGGPKRDIVTEVGGLATGFHASTSEQFAQGFESALSLPREDKIAMRLRARKSAQRFTEAEFAKKWIVGMEELVLLRRKWEGIRSQ
ncbi:hypothetical protein DID88_001084 [Monilinia fructigena]|uniref:ALG11 mannosyltransferase N-terminal domain-containing protein n=1 Tax=Monilinia fructigena TaxID=38457 RepID=A0A395J0C4_9HELO|nr:hypothetical protein DID88_001084 [Monilinia fructigena]